MKIAIISFTKMGLELQRRIVENFCEDFVVFDKSFEKASTFVAFQFERVDAIFFVGAVGIAVRLIKDFIKSKDLDPAVVVLDELGKFAIPILSGHLGGANLIAVKLSERFGMTPVITTATDLNERFAVDVWSRSAGCEIVDIGMIKHISSAILNDFEVGLFSDFEVFGDVPAGIVLNGQNEVGVCVSLDENLKPFLKTLNVVPKIVSIGVGCKKDTCVFEFEKFVLDFLLKNHISIKSLKEISSIDLKKTEPCIVQFCLKYSVRFVTFSAEELMAVRGEFTKSEFVLGVTGVDNVCERAAVLSSCGEILVKKTSENGKTIALALKKWVCKF